METSHLPMRADMLASMLIILMGAPLLDAFSLPTLCAQPAARLHPLFAELQIVAVSMSEDSTDERLAALEKELEDLRKQMRVAELEKELQALKQGVTGSELVAPPTTQPPPQPAEASRAPIRFDGRPAEADEMLAPFPSPESIGVDGQRCAIVFYVGALPLLRPPPCILISPSRASHSASVPTSPPPRHVHVHAHPPSACA